MNSDTLDTDLLDALSDIRLHSDALLERHNSNVRETKRMDMEHLNMMKNCIDALCSIEDRMEHNMVTDDIVCDLRILSRHLFYIFPLNTQDDYDKSSELYQMTTNANIDWNDEIPNDRINSLVRNLLYSMRMRYDEFYQNNANIHRLYTVYKKPFIIDRKNLRKSYDQYIREREIPLF